MHLGFRQGGFSRLIQDGFDERMQTHRRKTPLLWSVDNRTVSG